MGANPYGVMIVAGPAGFAKAAYRKFAIRGPVTPGDDFAMMREVLQRRFTRALREQAEGAPPGDWPDLVLIDGGAGQLSAARQTLQDLGVNDVKLVAIAKGPDRDAGREWFHTDGAEPFQLPRATRCCISCSGCATRRTALPSPRTAPADRRTYDRANSTRSQGSVRPASARC